MSPASTLKTLWTRALLKGAQFRDRHERLDLFYLLENPWRMGSEAELARFAHTNEIILREFGRPTRVLELGSGEGHQTEWLLKVSGTVHGREISRRAVERAQKRCRSATFSVGDLAAPFDPSAGPPFDLVVACEVLYYMSEPAAAVQQLSRLGAGCLVTYFQKYADDINSRAAFPKTAHRETIQHGDLQWTAVWWNN